MIQVPNKFVSYQFTEQELEELRRSVPQLTLNYIQTLLAQVAEDRLELVVDATNITEFIQNEAFLKGRIDTLSMLIEFFTPKGE